MEKPKNLPEPSREDWIRLAAFIDGEGAILLNARSGKRRKELWLRVVLVNTDIRMPVWCKENFGGTLVVENRKNKNPNHSIAYRWFVSCRNAAWIVKGCLPFFLIKREQAEIALTFQESLGGPGAPVSEETHVMREGLRQQLHSLKRVTPLFKEDPKYAGLFSDLKRKGRQPEVTLQ